MRIHGDKKLARRPGVERRSPYGAYLDILREDFSGICGYCGKSELVTKNTFEIDHLFRRSMHLNAKKIIQIWCIHAMYVIGKNRQSGFRKIKMYNLWMELDL